MQPERRRRPRKTPWLMWLIIAFLLLMVGLLLFNWYVLPQFAHRPATSPSPEPTTTSKAPNWGVQIKTSGCTANEPLQDTTCTPGDIFHEATKEQICKPGYASSVRNVPQSLKRKLYTQYGITQRLPGQYVIDHLVPLQLGGSNDASNLWPEKTAPPLGSYEKDKVETFLHDEMCSGAISLQQAQIAIAVDWVSVYNRMPDKLKNTPDTGKDDEG